MTFANVVKILLLIATLLTTAGGFFEVIKPTWAAVIGGIAAAIFAFAKAIEGKIPMDGDKKE